MKAFLVKYKFYLLIAVFISLGGFYYFFIYQGSPVSNQLMDESGKNPAYKKDDTDQKEQQPKPEKAETVMVDVKGEIKQPGVYTSNSMERVIDVIQRAGGLTDKADESQVNFAAHVQDEMVIFIPAKGAQNPNSVISNTSQADSSGNNGTNQSGKININKADANELQNLPGIGPAKAAAIIQYREENGPFKTMEDLKNISGIGDKTFEKLKEAIAVQ